MGKLSVGEISSGNCPWEKGSSGKGPSGKCPSGNHPRTVPGKTILYNPKSGKKHRLDWVLVRKKHIQFK